MAPSKLGAGEFSRAVKIAEGSDQISVSTVRITWTMVVGGSETTLSQASLRPSESGSCDEDRCSALGCAEPAKIREVIVHPACVICRRGGSDSSVVRLFARQDARR